MPFKIKWKIAVIPVSYTKSFSMQQPVQNSSIVDDTIPRRKTSGTISFTAIVLINITIALNHILAGMDHAGNLCLPTYVSSQKHSSIPISNLKTIYKEKNKPLRYSVISHKHTSIFNQMRICYIYLLQSFTEFINNKCSSVSADFNIFAISHFCKILLNVSYIRYINKH